MYENHHTELTEIADFLNRVEYRDSSFSIHIKTNGPIILPEKILRICRELNIAEIGSNSSENFVRLITGAFSNPDFDIDIYILKKGKQEFNIPNQKVLIENSEEERIFDYILGPYENVLFYSKALNPYYR